MISQLGIPTLFILLSAADTKWLELLQSIYKLTNKKNITHEQLEKMPWNEKCNLISKDPGTCAKQYKFFLYIMQQLLNEDQQTLSLFIWWSMYRKRLCIESYISRFKQNIKPETWTTNKRLNYIVISTNW